MQFVAYLIKSKLLLRIILLFLGVAAFLATGNLQRQGLPLVDFEQMNVQTFYPGASPEDVEVNITIKLEAAIREVDGVEKFTSISAEGSSRIKVFVDPDAADPREVKEEIRRAVQSVSNLPPELENDPSVTEAKIANRSIYEAALIMPGSNDRLTLRKHAKALKKRLEVIPEVSKIWEDGVGNREIQIQLDSKKMALAEVSFQEIIGAIRKNKLRMSGGNLESFTSEKSILTISEFDKPEDIGQIIVRASDLGYLVRIKDIAEVKDTFAEDPVIIKYNGETGMSLWVSKKANADVIEAVDAIKTTIKKYKTDAKIQPVGGLLPASINETNLDIVSTFDDSLETRNRLRIVTGNAILGFFLVVLVLFLFLDARTAIWTAAGIPLSLALTLTVLPSLGVTINSVSILGLIVVLGMVVDDAIIISESIYRCREQGMAAADAAIAGLRTVFKPVVGTILTTIIAFFPIYFFPGIIGDFAVEIPTMVIVMLLASLVEATTILPAHLAHSSADSSSYTPPGKKLMVKLEEGYGTLLKKAVKHKGKSSLAMITFLVLGLLISSQITRFDMFPANQSFKVWVYGRTTVGSSLAYTEQAVKEVYDAMQSIPNEVIHSTKTYVGRSWKGWTASAHSFNMKILLTQANKRNMTALELKDQLQKAVQSNPNSKLEEINFYIDSGGPPVGKQIEMRIIGNDNEKRQQLMYQAKSILQEYGVSDIESDNLPGKDELRILPDYRRVSMAGLDVETIATTIRTAFDGAVVTYLQTPEERVPFRLMLQDSDQNFENPLRNLLVRNQYGRLVPIENLVSIEKTAAQQTIRHFNGDRLNNLSANLDIKKITPKELYDQLEVRLENIRAQNPDFKIELGGEASESSKTYNHIFISIMLAILAIYFILVLQFDSITQPVMVILAIPFGVIGILIAFGLHGMDLSMLAMIGVLGFSGVVVNDSLIMVEFINRIKRNNQEINFMDAILQGSVLRLRPILLTTLSTMAGLIPTAYGFIGGFDYFISPMVLAITWGLIVGTLSVLIVIPVLYAVHHSASERLFSFWLQLTKR
jgi:multidrug efflux pump subunit AcrB